MNLSALLRKNIDASAHEAATSPHNLRPLPTKAQRNAGNYKVGRHTISGLNISIENPAGSIRDTAHPMMTAHYGYIRGTVGADGDHLDVFVKPGTPDDWNGLIYVIDQADETGKFDEAKAMLGYQSEAEARRAYLNHHAENWTGRIIQITPMTLDKFKAWMTGDLSAPVGKVSRGTLGRILRKGDVVGHEFHGNQYSGPKYATIRSLDEGRHLVESNTGERIGVYPTVDKAKQIADHFERVWMKEHLKELKAKQKAKKSLIHTALFKAKPKRPQGAPRTLIAAHEKRVTAAVTKYLAAQAKRMIPLLVAAYKQPAKKGLLQSALLKGFDPSEARDEKGQWTSDGGWKASMSPKEADAWAKDSKLQGSFFHGVGITEKGAVTSKENLSQIISNINASGFRVSTGAEVKNGAMLGNGVYMGDNKGGIDASRYGQVLELRVNVKNPFIAPTMRDWSSQYNKITREMKSSGLKLTPQGRIKWWAEKNGIDAIKTNLQTVVFNPKNITVVESYGKSLIHTLLRKADMTPDEIVDKVQIEGWESLVNTDITPEIEAALKAAGLYAATESVAAATAAPVATMEVITGLVNERAVLYAKEAAAELVVNITEATREMLRDKIAQAVREGWTSDQLQINLAESRAFSAERAMNIASYELGSALQAGNLIGWKESGVVTGKQWITADDELVSDECQANSEQGVIPIDEAFQSGDDAPLSHPNCRCVCVPSTEPIENND